MKVAEWDLNKLSDYEIKGMLMSLIGKAKRKQLISFIENLKQDTSIANTDIDNLPYALSPEQEAELMISLEESYHEENMIDLEESKKIHARWLKS
jgi:hypothetical protein